MFKINPHKIKPNTINQVYNNCMQIDGMNDFIVFVSDINPWLSKNRKRVLKQGFGGPEFKCLGISLRKCTFPRSSWNWKLKGTFQPDNNNYFHCTVTLFFHYSLDLKKTLYNTMVYFISINTLFVFLLELTFSWYEKNVSKTM